MDSVSSNGVIDFEEVSLEELEKSSPRATNQHALLIQQFLDTGRFAASPKLDGADSKKALAITQHARKYERPVRAMYRDGRIILKRVDIDQNGNAVVGWETGEEFRGSPSRRVAANKANETRQVKRAQRQAAGAR